MIFKILLSWANNLSRIQKQFIMVFADIIILEIAILFSYSLRQASWFWPDGDIEKLVYIAPFLSIPIFYLLGLYQSIVRYMGIKAFIHIFYAVSLYMIIWTIFGYYINVDASRSVLIYQDNGTIYKVNEYFSGFLVLCIINWLISVLLIGSSRIVARQIYWLIQDSIFHGSYVRKNILIYGAGDAGIQLATALNFSKELNVCAFIDDNKSIQGKFIYGFKVFKIEVLKNLIDSLSISEVLIAIPSLTEKQKSFIIKNLSKYPIKVSTIPGITEIAEGNFKIEDRKPIHIEDILGREKVPPIHNLLACNIERQNVLVTGAGGSIGSELSRQIIDLKPKTIVLLELSEFALYEIEKDFKNRLNLDKTSTIFVLGNVCDKQKLLNILRKYKIDILFHAAAYKHVPIVEKNIIEGFRNNVIGTLSSIEASISSNVKNFVHISTDKAVRPTNIMGATKRISEMIVQAYSEESYKQNYNKKIKFSTVRFGNVLGSSGSVLPLFTEQIKSGGPITLTHKAMTRYFMTIQEAAQLVIQASAIKSDNASGNLFVLDMGKPVKIIDLAKKMVELSGLKWKLSRDQDGDIEIIIVGLRPGEKLFEELMIGNSSKKTEHPKIIQINEKFEPLRKIIKAIAEFNEDNNTDNILRTKNLLKRIVKDYNPEN